MKKIKFMLFLIILLTLSNVFVYGESSGDVYVIPIKGEINRATRNFVVGTIDGLNQKNAEAIILDIDTYGGLIDEAIMIKDAILETNIPTIAFVNNKAESAGVLITLAGENIVMAPNGTIGSAETIPNTEKVLSLWRAILRDTAQYRDRDSSIIEAMADRDIEIDGIIEKGKLLNLTSQEALEYGIADYISNDYNDILANFGFNNTNIVEKQEGFQMKLSKYISNPYISSILLTIAFVGLVVEIMTPGFGLGGTISIIGFGLYFGGNILAGNSHWTSLALFVTGLILLVIEGIVPGFGLPGISGIIFVLVGIVLAMNSFGVALLSMSVAIIITTIVTMVLFKLGFRSNLLNSIVLTARHEGKGGYIATDHNEEYLNKKGKTLSGLRPSGFVEIEGKKIDALSDEGYIPIDTLVEVVRIEGSKIFVRRV